MKSILIGLVGTAVTLAAVAKLPAPSDEAKAKAAEAAAKTAHTGKADNYLLCKAQDKAAASYFKTVKTAGKDVKPAIAVPPCADPGPFVYAPAVAASAPQSAPAPAAATEPKKS